MLKVFVANNDRFYAIRAYDRNTLLYCISGEDDTPLAGHIDMLALTEALESLEKQESKVYVTSDYSYGTMKGDDHRKNRDLHKRCMSAINRKITIEKGRLEDRRMRMTLKMLNRHCNK